MDSRGVIWGIQESQVGRDLMKVRISLLFLSGIVNWGKHPTTPKKIASHQEMSPKRVANLYL